MEQHFDRFRLRFFNTCTNRPAATRVPSSETRCEYIHVRSVKNVLFFKVSEGGTRIPAQVLWILVNKLPSFIMRVGAFIRISYAPFMREQTDEQLMQQYAKGKAQAFDQLYSRHRGALYRYFRRQVSDEATANDLYQGVWEKIIKARKKYRPSSPFTAWMYRIAHNHLVDHYRSVKPVAQTEMETFTDMHAEPPEHAIDGQQRQNLQEKIAALPPEQRNTLLLKLETGLKMEEIATVTGASRETVKSRLRYAVDKLKRSLVE